MEMINVTKDLSTNCLTCFPIYQMAVEQNTQNTIEPVTVVTTDKCLLCREQSENEK